MIDPAVTLKDPVLAPLPMVSEFGEVSCALSSEMIRVEISVEALSKLAVQEATWLLVRLAGRQFREVSVAAAGGAVKVSVTKRAEPFRLAVTVADSFKVTAATEMVN